MVCYPAGKKKVGGKLAKPYFAQFVFIVELIGVCDYFDDDAGW
jgi:hypothetical protein